MIEADLDYTPHITSSWPGKQWWIVAASIFIGALIGYGLSFLFPPIYEATFTITSNVKLTDDPKITEFMVDNALLHVGELAYQQPLMDQVIAAEKTKGINLTVPDLKRISTVERKITSTYLKVRWTNAATAAQLANTWGNLFYASLVEGARQAVIAEELTQMQTWLENCLTGIQTPSKNTFNCSLSIDETQKQIEQNAEKIAAAESASLGLYRQLRVNSYEEALIPTAPIRRERGWLIAAGAGIGFIVSLILTEIAFHSSDRLRSQ
jgi:uncharacterized protein involved in exopolysaccharide biosynthesis